MAGPRPPMMNVTALVRQFGWQERLAAQGLPGALVGTNTTNLQFEFAPIRNVTREDRPLRRRRAALSSDTESRGVADEAVR